MLISWTHKNLKLFRRLKIGTKCIQRWTMPVTGSRNGPFGSLIQFLGRWKTTCSQVFLPLPFSADDFDEVSGGDGSDGDSGDNEGGHDAPAAATVHPNPPRPTPTPTPTATAIPTTPPSTTAAATTAAAAAAAAATTTTTATTTTQ